MVEVESERGSSLIWFTAILGLVLSVVLVLASSINQYLLARELTDYAEEFAIASKTLLNQGDSLSLSKQKLKVATEGYFKNTPLQLASVKLVDDKTVEVIVCGTWDSPFAIMALERVLCERALSR